MKLSGFLSSLTACILLIGILSGCGDPKIHLDSETKPPLGIGQPSTDLKNDTTSQSPVTDPIKPEDPFFSIDYLSHNVRQGMYVVVSEKNPLASNYQYQLENIKLSFEGTPILLRKSDLLLNPQAIMGLKQLCIAFYETFGTNHRYLPLIQNAYDSDDRTSEHATGYAVDFHFWDTQTELVYDLGNLSVSAETEFIHTHLETYGFISRYSDQPEHLRYIGSDLANSLKDADMTFDTFIARVLTCNHSSPFELSHYQVYTILSSNKMTTTIPLPRDVKDYFITGLNNRYFLILIPHQASKTEKGCN